jgi:DNA replication protein DnaC
MDRINTPTSHQSNGQTSASDPWLGFDPEWGDVREATLQLRGAQEKTAAWVNGKIKGLVLAGHPGAGKSHLARVAFNHFNDLLKCLLIAEPDLLSDVRGSYDGNRSESAQSIINRLRRSPLLILDDIGTGYVKQGSEEWLYSIYWQLLDRRAERGMSVLMTTNLKTPDLAVRLGPRGFSRLLELMKGDDGEVDKSNLVDMFSVPDYRMKGWKQAA